MMIRLIKGERKFRMNYLSVFSGIEATSVAWEPLGFIPLGFSETDPFPCAILKYRFPDIENFFDIRNFKEWKIEKPVDVVVGGSPCQSFSIAGNRKGIEDERGRLMLTYGNMVNYFKPRWIVWENVPGVLSSNGGKNFLQFISILDEYGYGLAWRILDAQYFGVPQRRRRIFLIGYYGDIRYSASVLFDFQSGKGNIKKVCARGSSQRIEGGRGAVYNNNPADSRIKEADNIINAVIFNRSINSKYSKSDIATTLLGGFHDSSIINITIQNNLVRRITPREAERLQGFPDDWTKVPYKNKSADKCPDSLRYKAIGNSMAVPVMRWIGKRILLTEKIFKED
jgi:DNA (cytosine-5)-methyltransferase 1